MANRLLRDSFPADWLFSAPLKQGISLLWLTTGQGEMYPQTDEKNKSKKRESATVRPLSKIVVPPVKQVTIEGGTFNELDDITLIRADFR